MTIFRGAQCAALPDAVNLQVLANHDVNIIRRQITFEATELSLADWKSTIRDHLDHMDSFPAAPSVIDLHSMPDNVFTDNAARNAVIEMWIEIAARYRSNPAVHAYGIMNEPRGSLRDVWLFMQRCAREIRKVDKAKPICVTTPNSGSSFSGFKPLKNLGEIWYEIHCYWPMELTHQGIGGRPIGVTYPSPTLNREDLRNSVIGAIRFARRNNVQIYVGEFSISSFTDVNSRVAFLTDMISIFEEEQWHWTYHAWREASVWDAEPEPRVLEVLTNRWGKNP